MTEPPVRHFGSSALQRTHRRQRRDWRADGSPLFGCRRRTAFVDRFHRDLAALVHGGTLAEEGSNTFAAVGGERRRGDGPGLEFHL